MARVTLTLSEVSSCGLPPRCICCGERMAVYQGKYFLAPWWQFARLRWAYAGAVGAAVLALHYCSAGLWQWIAFAVLNCGIGLGAWRAVRSNKNRWLLVYTPLCKDHQNYWQRYEWWQNQGLPLLAGIPLVGLWVWAMALHYSARSLGEGSGALGR